MDAELKTKWVAALRSGEYPQTKGLLKRHRDRLFGDRPNGFCCLGVLCDVIDPTKWVMRHDSDGYEWNGENAAMLPGSVASTCGIIDTAPLMMMNDNDGKTFAEIADYIEENL